MVSEYLSLKGVPKDKITTRWHGERYQVETNRTRKGRAKNRRVTIRLEKADAAKVPRLARGNVRTGAQ
jgi:outer membrane protein OmpA-like peptidoglycan-associated protein